MDESTDAATGLTITITDRRDPASPLVTNDADLRATVGFLSLYRTLVVSGITFEQCGGQMSHPQWGKRFIIDMLHRVSRLGPGEHLPPLPDIIQRLDEIDEDAWHTGPTYRTKNGQRHCVLSHIYDIYGEKAMDEFESIYSSIYVIGRVNDGKNPRYPQSSPKNRVLAYLGAMCDDREMTTPESLDDQVRDLEDKDAGYRDVLEWSGRKPSIVVYRHTEMVARFDLDDLHALTSRFFDRSDIFRLRNLDDDQKAELSRRNYLRFSGGRTSLVPTAAAYRWATMWERQVSDHLVSSGDEHLERRGQRPLLLVAYEGRRVCNIDAADLRKLASTTTSGIHGESSFADHRTFNELMMRGFLVQTSARGCMGARYNSTTEGAAWANEWLRRMAEFEENERHEQS